MILIMTMWAYCCSMTSNQVLTNTHTLTVKSLTIPNFNLQEMRRINPKGKYFNN